MSHTELIVVAEKDDVFVKVDKPISIDLKTMIRPDLKVILAGNMGPRGPQGQWEALTQYEYDQLHPPNPDTLYVIIQ